MLQEAELTTLSESDCASFGKTMKVDTKFEICAGKKIPKIAPKTFEKSQNKFLEVANKELQKTDDKSFLLGELDTVGIWITD